MKYYKPYIYVVRSLINIILSSCLLITGLVGSPNSNCLQNELKQTSQQSCCKTKLEKTCCCFDKKKECSCMHSSESEQTSNTPIQYVSIKKPIQATCHAFYLNAKQIFSYSSHINKDYIRHKLSTEVQKILPLLN